MGLLGNPNFDDPEENAKFSFLIIIENFSYLINFIQGERYGL